MSPHVFTILRALSAGDFLSGEQLAGQLGVSRASIWNAIQDIEKLGLRIFKVRGRGYQLVQDIEWLDAHRIRTYMGNAAEELSIEILDQAESTNSLLMRRLSQAQSARHCIVAEWQTQGRGRRGRTWEGVVGGSVMYSLLWRFNLGAAQLSGLSLAVGVALARALDEAGMRDIQLKWPNDLMHNFRKLGGVLVELQGEAMGPSHAVIGVGLNYRLTPQAKNRVDQAVTDMHEVMGKVPSRNTLLGTTLRHLAGVLRQFEAEGFAVLREEWQQRHAYHDKPVQVRLPDGSSAQGRVKGVMADGSLSLETASGERRFGSGEISLRPLHVTPLKLPVI